MIAELLMGFITSLVSSIGYPGIAILMMLESMVAPVPSEAVMPFVGFLVYAGKFNLIFVIIASSIGSILGSLVSYYVGFYGGKPLVLKVGKYLLLEEKHLDLATAFFQKYGSITIFVSRFVPVMRHLISIPAGIGKMNKKKFFVYTLAGATIWNSILVYFGMKLGAKWATISNYSEILDVIIVGLIIIGAIYYIIKLRKKSKTAAAK